VKILLTCTGFHDPYTLGLTGEEQAGPILTLVAEMSFNRIILFSTTGTIKNTAATQKSLATRHPNIKVEIRNLEINDPINYLHIIDALRTFYLDIDRQNPNAEYVISVTSGTPQMHACWLLLAACGEIPAQIINVRPRRFITDTLPLINTLDLAAAELPQVRSNICMLDLGEDFPPPDMETIISNIGIVGSDTKFKSALEMAAKLAASELTVLILGETGSGKELFAKFIHRCSGRKGPLVILNCANIPDTLAESELFGYEKGAFTGASQKRAGKFTLAHEGTLFLDELEALSLSVQAKLLRVIQDKMVDPLGAKKPTPVDVRIILATNTDPAILVKEGKFREDLYYRVNVGCIRIPPLRDRRDDIPRLALHFLDQANRSQRQPKRISTEALKLLRSYSWPGNVRELENVIQRCALLSKSQTIEREELTLLEAKTYDSIHDLLPEPYAGFSLDGFIKDIRLELYRRAYRIADGNQTNAAKLLGVTSESVRKMKTHFSAHN